MLSLYKNNKKKHNFLKYLSIAEIKNIVSYINDLAHKEVCQLKDIPEFDENDFKEINSIRREFIKKRLQSAKRKKTKQISAETAKKFSLIKIEFVFKYQICKNE